MDGKIISLVDGSTYSQSVCEHAAWAARQLDASVEIMHVIGRREASDTGDRSGAIALGARTALLEKLSSLDAERARLLHEQGRAILEDAARILSENGVTQIEQHLFRGDLVDLFAEREKKAALVVVGKRGEAADFASLHLGSNLERIVRTSEKPVLVASRAFKPVGKVLIAWDGGATSRKAVELAANSPLLSGLDVDIVYVGRTNGDIEESLSLAVEQLSAAGHDASSHVIDGQPEKALGTYVKDNSVDLVVMGAYGHSRIRSLIIGSTTTEMIRSCLVPVLLVR
ncbi:universal stress protein [Pseudohoeflea suaedae]|uniref:Universal stress protein n=1 Tax=Pseudohoeflea suaedae TaxID=877384 RepID=A0A4R5PKF9_9HYPH|nr:universal stress protein [Pseudohoeflea suaedae]TDH36200.1 universal stress protein [Pseudohoeflea suaedae]